jgi:FKBP-type peptidyl-prolyl cis-trans isomerase
MYRYNKEDAVNRLLALFTFLVLVSVFTAVPFAEKGIVTLESGLKYKDLEIGTGATAELGKVAVIHITGWLDNNGQKGQKFLSSYDRGKPVSFMIGTERVMQGWNQGVVGMKAGGKRSLLVPSELGYGAQGVSDVVPPNTDLIFTVELLEVK